MIRRLVIALSRIALLAVLMTCASTALADDSADVAKRADALQPNNRAVSFRSMDSIFPHNVIKRGTVVTELPRTPHKLDITYSFAGKQQTLDDLLRRSRTQGFLVVKGGNIIDERYFKGADEKSRFTSWSVGKSFTSTLVGLALADGLIKSLDDPVTNYLPELKGTGYANVPIKYILEMSSGVKFTEEYANGESDISIMWR